MSLPVAFGFALLCGFAVAAACGNYAEWREGARGGFHPPFVEPGKIMRSLLLALVAGPHFLLREVDSAHASGRAGPLLMAAGIAVSLIWMLASGIVILAASEQIVALTRV
jgi:hypothetical protein